MLSRSNYEAITLVDVSGTVKLDGNPLPDAIVKFESADGQYSVGKTDSSGQYTLQFDSEKQGVTPGEKTVRISTAASLGEGGEEEDGGSEGQPANKTELVPEKYNKKSELKRTVEPKGDQTFDFNLKSR